VINLTLTSLRERKDDIPLLVDFFIKKFNKVYNKTIIGIDKKVEDAFMSHDWPGNIRELENTMERATIMSQGNLVDISLIPDSINPDKRGREEGFNIKSYILDEIKKSHESEIYSDVIGKLDKILIEEMLIETGYNKSRTAEMLGINRNTLKSKIKEYKII
jgi:arginine utilization regulatory protein